MRIHGEKGFTASRFHLSSESKQNSFCNHYANLLTFVQNFIMSGYYLMSLQMCRERDTSLCRQGSFGHVQGHEWIVKNPKISGFHVGLKMSLYWQDKPGWTLPTMSPSLAQMPGCVAPDHP